MHKSISTGLLVSVLSLGTSGASAQEVICSSVGGKTEMEGCTAKNRQYVARLIDGKCSTREATDPKTGKKGPALALDANYQVFQRYNEGGSKGLHNFGHHSITVYGDSMRASCANLVNYAGNELLKKLDSQK